MPDNALRKDHATDPAPQRRPLVLAASMAAIFMAAVEGTIVATAMPTIVADLGGFRLFTWVFAVYLLAQAVTIPIYGRLADLYGRKPVFYVGAGIFLAGSTLSGFAQSMIMLVIFRALQGLGAGAIMPIATTIVGDIYVPAERARVQGYLSSVWGVASVVGPALGAFLVQQVSWRVIFWINLPIGGGAIALLALFLHQRPQLREHKIDYLGSLLLMLGVGMLMLALVQGEILGAAATGGLIVLAVAILAALFLYERRAVEPMLPLELWRIPIIATCNGGGFLVGMLIMAVSAFLPIYVQGVLGLSPMAAGLVLTVMSLSWTFGSIAAGRLMLRTSYRTSAMVGGFALVLGSGFLATLHGPSALLWATVGGMFAGLGMGFCNTTFVVSVQASVGFAARGAATSSNIFMLNVGEALGAGVFGAILNFGIFRQLHGGSGAVSQLMDPALRRGLALPELDRLNAAVAGAIHELYLAAALCALIALLLTSLLPKGKSPISP